MCFGDSCVLELLELLSWFVDDLLELLELPDGEEEEIVRLKGREEVII